MSHMVTDIIQERVPVLEKAMDEFYLDLSDISFYCYRIADTVLKKIQVSLHQFCIIYKNKTVSK